MGCPVITTYSENKAVIHKESPGWEVTVPNKAELDNINHSLRSLHSSQLFLVINSNLNTVTG